MCTVAHVHKPTIKTGYWALRNPIPYTYFLFLYETEVINDGYKVRSHETRALPSSKYPQIYDINTHI